MFLPDPGLPGAIILIAAVVVAGMAVWAVDRRRRRGRAASKLHSMARDDSISYFRDLSANSSNPGIREEDRQGPWGEGG